MTHPENVWTGANDVSFSLLLTFLLTFTLKHRLYPQLNPEPSPVLYLSARIEGAHELIMALKEIYQIKIGPLAPRWRHHDMPTITDKKLRN